MRWRWAKLAAIAAVLTYAPVAQSEPTWWQAVLINLFPEHNWDMVYGAHYEAELGGFHNDANQTARRASPILAVQFAAYDYTRGDLRFVLPLLSTSGAGLAPATSRGALLALLPRSGRVVVAAGGAGLGACAVASDPWGSGPAAAAGFGLGLMHMGAAVASAQTLRDRALRRWQYCLSVYAAERRRQYADAARAFEAVAAGKPTQTALPAPFKPSQQMFSDALEHALANQPSPYDYDAAASSRTFFIPLPNMPGWGVRVSRIRLGDGWRSYLSREAVTSWVSGTAKVAELPYPYGFGARHTHSQLMGDYLVSIMPDLSGVMARRAFNAPYGARNQRLLLDYARAVHEVARRGLTIVQPPNGADGVQAMWPTPKPGLPNLPPGPVIIDYERYVRAPAGTPLDVLQHDLFEYEFFNGGYARSYFRRQGGHNPFLAP